MLLLFWFKCLFNNRNCFCFSSSPKFVTNILNEYLLYRKMTMMKSMKMIGLTLYRLPRPQASHSNNKYEQVVFRNIFNNTLEQSLYHLVLPWNTPDWGFKVIFHIKPLLFSVKCVHISTPGNL